MTRRIFRRRGRASYSDPMAHNSRLISTAIEVALDRRYRSDEDRIAATQARFPDAGPSALAAAEMWAVIWGTVLEEAEAAREGDAARRLLARIRDNHRSVVRVR